MIKKLNGREIHFTGEELSDIRPLTSAYKNIKTLEELFEILLLRILHIIQNNDV